MLTVHFLNVGHGECTLIEHPSGRLTMIDINTSHEYDDGTLQEIVDEYRAQNRFSLFTPPSLLNVVQEIEAKVAANKELTDPIFFLQTNYPGRSLFRFVLTHPDLDHMRGLKRLRETVGFANFWDVNHTKTTPDFRGDKDREEWEHYLQLRSGDFGHIKHRYTRGDACYAFAKEENGASGGDNVEILSPTPSLVASCNSKNKSNDLSYVLRIGGGGSTILLTGDIEQEAWNDIVSAYGARLKSDVLQASHHGRDSGYHLAALRLINPSVVVVSVGRKPDTDASKKYSIQGAQVWSTRHYGNLTLKIDNNGTRNWIAQRNGSS